ncbi:hypothetical protein SynA1528_02347 [Synechococcus sp. A15-28]|nr:hypothetical protein SynA1528_02347 [Synechococcus sp. A15-28]
MRIEYPNETNCIFHWESFLFACDERICTQRNDFIFAVFELLNESLTLRFYTHIIWAW